MKKKFCRKCFVISFVALVALALGYWVSFSNRGPDVDLSAIQSSLKQATLLPYNFKQVPEFSLNNQHEEQVGRELFVGKWSLVFFGYTHCPDVCPNSMAVLKQASQLLSENPELPAPQVVFVSVDPRRDTPQQLKSYMSYFDGSFVALSGDESETLQFTRTLGVVYRLEEGYAEKENYLVDHSAAFLLINPDGGLQALLSSPHEARTIASDYQRIVDALS